MNAGTATPALTADEAHWLRPALTWAYRDTLEHLARLVDTTGQLSEATLRDVRDDQAELARFERRLEAIGWTDAGFDPDVWITNEALSADEVLELAVRRRDYLVDAVNREQEQELAGCIRGLSIVQGLIDRLSSAEAGR